MAPAHNAPNMDPAGDAIVTPPNKNAGTNQRRSALPTTAKGEASRCQQHHETLHGFQFLFQEPASQDEAVAGQSSRPVMEVGPISPRSIMLPRTQIPRIGNSTRSPYRENPTISAHPPSAPLAEW